MAVVEVQVGLVSGKAGLTAPRGGAWRAGGGHAEVAEDAVDNGGILDGGEELHAAVMDGGGGGGHSGTGLAQWSFLLEVSWRPRPVRAKRPRL